jgi:hypothetical protein
VLARRSGQMEDTHIARNESSTFPRKFPSTVGGSSCNICE